MENIIKKVTEIACRIKDLELAEFDNYTKISLTGEKFQFDAVDMCYLALEVSRFYSIRLDKEDLEDQQFHSIAQIIFRKLNS